MKKLLKNGLLLDAAHDYEALDVLVEGEYITAVGKDLPADGAEIIDLGGKTLMPTFIDAHVHVQPFIRDHGDAVLKALAYNGISAVKDLGILDSIELEGYLDWLAPQDEPGKARVATAGRYIDVPGGYGVGPAPGETWGIIIDTPEEAADMVTYQFRAGVDGIKIGISDGSMSPLIAKLSPEHVHAITERAKEYGIWTSAHVYTADDLKMLVDNGIGEAAHTPNDALIDDEPIAKMAERGIPMTTTLGDETRDRGGHVPPWFASAEEYYAQCAAKRAMSVENLKKLYAAGGKINIGTDFMRCEDPMKEAVIPVTELRALRQRVGMSMHDVICAGTINAARSCGFADEGAIRPGNRASMLAFTGELDDDFAKLTALEFVMNRGEVLRG